MEKLSIPEIAVLTGKQETSNPSLWSKVLLFLMAIAFFVLSYGFFTIYLDYFSFFAFIFSFPVSAILVVFVRAFLFKLIGQNSKSLQVRFVNGKLEALRKEWSVLVLPESEIRAKVQRQVFADFPQDNPRLYENCLNGIITYPGNNDVKKSMIFLDVRRYLARKIDQKIIEYRSAKTDLEEGIAHLEGIISELKK